MCIPLNLCIYLLVSYSSNFLPSFHLQEDTDFPVASSFLTRLFWGRVVSACLELFLLLVIQLYDASTMIYLLVVLYKSKTQLNNLPFIYNYLYIFPLGFKIN